MKKTTILFLLLTLALLVTGCARGAYSPQAGYATGPSPQGQYIGGGCNVQSPDNSDLHILTNQGLEKTIIRDGEK